MPKASRVLNKYKALQSDQRMPPLQVLKAAVAVVAAWFLGLLIFPHSNPVLASVTALLLIQPSINQALRRGIENSVGAIIGVSLALVMSYFLPYKDSPLVTLSALVGIGVAWVLKLNQYAAMQLAVSAMFVYVVVPTQNNYGFERILEIVLGVIVGFLINFLVVPPILLEPAYRQLRQLVEITSQTMLQLSKTLVQRSSYMQVHNLEETLKKLQESRLNSHQAISEAKDSMRLNPRSLRLRDRFSEDLESAQALEKIIDHLTDMVQVYLDHYSPRLRQDPTVRDIARQLEKTSHDLRLLKRRWRDVNLSTRLKRRLRESFGKYGRKIGQPPTEAIPTTRDTPMLTSPLAIPKPDPAHWIMIGSMAADLGRIHKLLTRLNQTEPIE